MPYVKGWNASNVNANDIDDVEEFDITFDYKPRGDFIEGLWLGVRYAEKDIGGDDARDFRAILNYPVKIPFLVVRQLRQERL